jgi:acetyl-CoA C-acetyltransferase
MTSEHLPVILGVGQLRNNRERTYEQAREPLDLIVDAVRRAGDDAGKSDALLSAVDAISIVRVMSWAYDDLAADVAARLGVRPTILFHSDVGGNRPAELLDIAARRISSGETSVEIVCGGESTASLAACRAAEKRPLWTTAPGGPVKLAAGDFASEFMLRYGLMQPVQTYPLYENGLRAALDQSFAEAQQWSADLYSTFSAVAASNDAAWDPVPRTAEEIRTAGPGNRYICWPYPLLMNAQNRVDQAGAVIVTSVAKARELGIADSRMVHVWGGAGASDSTDVFQRVAFDRSPALESVLRATLVVAEIGVDEIDDIDAYSCFPIVPKVAALALGKEKGETKLTVTGGLNAFGGPANNYSTHAIIAMARRIRDDGGVGLVYANGEHLTKHHAVLLADRAHDRGYIGVEQVPAFATDAPPLTEAEEHDVRIETYTVQFDRSGAPEVGWVMARTANENRAPSLVDDPATLAFLIDESGQPVGTRGDLRTRDDGRLSFVPKSLLA